MDFAGAIKAGLKNYVNFRGRATRPEYWWFVLFAFLVSLVASVIDAVIGLDLVGNLASIALLLPQLGLLFRRFRDAGVSPTWLLTYLIPLVATVYVVFANAEAFGKLVEDMAAYGEDPQGLQNAMMTGGYMEILTFPILGLVGIWLAWALFEFIITLLPTKKQPEPPVAIETTA
jgi:uncharacterized membrane protein YhaH (DUF805 family)